MPIRNEAAFIERSLGAVLAQDYPAELMEILVVDGMSNDNTREIVTRFKYYYPQYSIHILDNPSQIVSTGFNQALQVAKGEVIIRVDGHTEIAPDYVHQCVLTLQDSQADNVGGRMTAIGVSCFGEAVALATSTPFGVGGARFHYSNKKEWVDTVYLGAWPREVFQRIGLFDEEFVRNQDDEFNYRLREQGGKILLNPSIKSVYIVRSSARALWKQYFQYGFWKVRVLQKHPRQMRGRQFIPPLFVFSLVFFAIWMLFSPTGFLGLALVISLYLLANVLASFITAAKNKWRHLWLLPIVFGILHLSYGLGFWVGFFYFLRRWVK